MQEPADRPLLNAAAMLGDRVEPLPSRAVLVFDESLVPRRRRRRDPAPFRQVAVAGGNPAVAVVAAIGPGAPTAAVTVEFLAHLGVRSLIAVGVAGDLRPDPDDDRSCATFFPVSRSIGQDGTSARYGSCTTADTDLTADLVAATGREAVTSVTTDTPLLHTAADVARLGQSGQLIEMETAAMFSVAAVRGVRCGALLVTSDGYTSAGSGDDTGPDPSAGLRWSQGDPAVVRAWLATAITTATAVLEQHSDNGRGC